MSRATPPEPIPLTVVTGFLGAGKTTFLNRALREPALTGTLVVVNEFGETPLDQHFLGVDAKDLVVLASGCLCCTIRGQLTGVLEDLLRRKDNRRGPDFSRVVIETTGLADPAPVLAAVLAHPYLSRRYRVASVVTLADIGAVVDQVSAHTEAQRQIALADVLLLTKTDDRQVQSRLPEAVESLKAHNPTAPILDGAAALEFERVLFGHPFAPQQRNAAARAHLFRESLRPSVRHDADHDSNRHSRTIRTFSIALGNALPLSGAQPLLAGLAQAFGTRILRMKGLARLHEAQDRALVLHMVHGRAAPIEIIAVSPGDVNAPALVFIGDDLDETAVRAFVRTFLDAF